MMLLPSRLTCVTLFCAFVVVPCHAGSFASSASSARLHRQRVRFVQGFERQLVGHEDRRG
jgi:hypothetical protein